VPSAPVVLASSSPQRRALLEMLGVPFDVHVPGVVEEETGPPLEVASENAFRKAAAVAAAEPERTVLGADTLVAQGRRIYGKPRDAEHARETLTALGGRDHVVFSGVCVIEPGRPPRTAVAQTTVRFRTLDAALLDWYLATEEWRGRAGGYAVQGRGAALVERIEGDFTGVVGLPVPTLLELLPTLLDTPG
jgi:septum formation protein